MKIVDAFVKDYARGQKNVRIAHAAPVLLRAALAVKSSGENSARTRSSKYGDVTIAASAWDELIAAIATATD